MRMTAATLLLLAMGVAETAGAADTATGPARAIEGDLLEVGGQQVRLYGVDAPEKGQRCTNRRNRDYDCFELSRNALERLTKGRTVVCNLEKPPPTPRVGRCRLDDGRDVAGVMAFAGWVLAYRRIALDYVPQEAKAATARRGLWGGRIIAPWIWRDQQLENKFRQDKPP